MYILVNAEIHVDMTISYLLIVCVVVVAAGWSLLMTCFFIREEARRIQKETWINGPAEHCTVLLERDPEKNGH